MNNPHGIIVFGANGSGKTTIGRELARILNYKRMDSEDYYFKEPIGSEIPYTNSRSRDEVIKLMLDDIEKYRTFVISTVKGDLGDKITQFYKLAVHITVPFEIRMQRVRQRDIDKYGERVLKSGDMYEQEQKYYDFLANRDLSIIDEWAKTLMCPVIQVDGTVDWRKNAADIAEQFMSIIKYDTP